MMNIYIKLKRSLVFYIYRNVEYISLVKNVLILDVHNPSDFTRVRISLNNIEKMEISNNVLE